ncbi:hypothetical protein AVEN_80307-1 [Araneus ventricosus]|uniref:Uncharacterized protein n=1 Tax=Araneus ventricosus TaxID=182803 RepID=A0A4Y2IJ96_ARAVE|nr:hypothetical protein AVEN_80307-1 [Araneus ventricosus]
MRVRSPPILKELSKGLGLVGRWRFAHMFQTPTWIRYGRSLKESNKISTYCGQRVGKATINNTQSLAYEVMSLYLQGAVTSGTKV